MKDWISSRSATRSPDDDVAGAHRDREQRAHLHLPAVPGQLPEQALEVGRVEGLAPVERRTRRGPRPGGRRSRAGARPGPAPRAGAPARAGGRRRSRGRRGPETASVGHVHEALQRVVELARAVELPRAPALVRHLPQGLGRARRRRGGAGGLVVELVDPVLEPGELGEGRGEPPLLAGERAVHGQDEGDVADGRGERRLAVEGGAPPGGSGGSSGRRVGEREERGQRRPRRGRPGGPPPPRAPRRGAP